MAFRNRQRQVLEQVRRTLVVGTAGAHTRLPIEQQAVEEGVVRAEFDAVSLAAYFGSLGYPAKTEHTQRVLQALPPDGETALGDVADVIPS